MLKLRHRFAIAIISITLVVMTSLGIIIGQLYKDFYYENLTDRLKKEADLAAYTLAEKGLDLTDVQVTTMELSRRLDARVTIISNDGTVIGESSTDPHLMDNHDLRPEISALINGGEGESVRYSETLNEEMLYYAVPIYLNPNEEIGYVRLGIPTTTLQQVNYSVWITLAVSFSIAFLIIVLITFRVVGRMIKPIESVTKVANELVKGNYDARASESNDDEIGLLTRSINVLAHHINKMTSNYQTQQEHMATLIENMGSGLIFMNMRGEIILINQTCQQIFENDTNLWVNHLYYDVIKQKAISKFIQTLFITEKKQRDQIYFTINHDVHHYDLYGAPILNSKGHLTGIAMVLHEITELKRLEQVRKDFVANVSHELNTPVTSIKGFTETLLDESMDTEPLREKFLTIIFKESERLQHLIQELLELSRIEQHYFVLNWEATDLSQVLEEVTVLLKDKTKEKEVTLNLNVHGDSMIVGDRERLKQIIINLVHNSLNYTRSDGQITITLTGHERYVELKIADTGIGISEEALPRIFERFYRVDPARSRESGGTGLGLAIVKHLVEAHNGYIKVESQIGIGTTFTITLKREQD